MTPGMRNTRRRPRREPMIIEIEQLLVVELARDLHGRAVVVVRIPDEDEDVEPELVEVQPVMTTGMHALDCGCGCQCAECRPGTGCCKTDCFHC